MPDITFNTLDEVPEGLRQFAKADDATRKVTVNVVANDLFSQLKTDNGKLTQDLAQVKSRFDGTLKALGVEEKSLDSFLKEAFPALLSVQQRVKDGQLVASTSLEEALNQRIGQFKNEMEGKNKALETDRDAWKTKAEGTESKLRNTFIDRAITEAVLDPKLGIRPEALPDILTRAYRVMKVHDDNKVVPYDTEGKPRFGADAATFMTAGEWLKTLKEPAPYFFKDSSGGGASGGTSAGGTVTPEALATANMSDYKRIRAEQLKQRG